MESIIIFYNEKKYEIIIIRKKIKNINLRVKATREIMLSIPNRISIKYAKEFVQSKMNWIEKQIKAFENLPVKKDKLDFKDGEITYFLGKQYYLKMIPDKINKMYIEDSFLCISIKQNFINKKTYIEKVYNKMLKNYVLELTTKLTKEYQEKLSKYKVPMPEIIIKNVKTKWGSCMPSKNKVIYSLKLAYVPMKCIEYVALHELSHYKYMNHSKQFYSFIEQFMPDWKQRRNILNKKYSKLV